VGTTAPKNYCAPSNSSTDDLLVLYTLLVELFSDKNVCKKRFNRMQLGGMLRTAVVTDNKHRPVASVSGDMKWRTVVYLATIIVSSFSHSIDAADAQQQNIQGQIINNPIQ